MVLAALRRPVSIIVAVLALVLTALAGLSRMSIDIFPTMGFPVIYVAQSYGGFNPAWMEGFSI
jgi:multidrug efflux pump subunit AcrB